MRLIPGMQPCFNIWKSIIHYITLTDYSKLWNLQLSYEDQEQSPSLFLFHIKEELLANAIRKANKRYSAKKDEIWPSMVIYTIILATWEEEIRRITVRGQLQEKVSETSHLNKQSMEACTRHPSYVEDVCRRLIIWEQPHQKNPQDPIWKIIKAKRNLGGGSSDRVLHGKVQGPKFKSQYCI
jgi:hypothetical protein